MVGTEKTTRHLDERPSSTVNSPEGLAEDPLADTSPLILTGGSTRRGSP